MGLKIFLLPEYFDVDRPEDLAFLDKKISVIVPVYNEEDLILRQLERIRQSANDVALELIVVDGGSSDRTVERAKPLADEVLVSPRPGRAAQMHLGAQKSSGDLLFFLHADTLLPENWALILQNAFSRNGNSPAAAAFDLSFDSDRWPYRVIEGLARIRNRITGVPQGDQGLIVQREAYFGAGGFPDVPLMEEYFLLPELKKRGKVTIIEEAVRTSARRYERSGPFRNALKNIGITLAFFAGVSPEKLAKWYRS